MTNGNAYNDACGNCVGGDTGLQPCVVDCNNDPGGSAYYDECGNCVGGNTGMKSCVQLLLCGTYHGYIDIISLNNSKNNFSPHQEQFIINLANLAALYELGGSLNYLKTDLDNYNINSSAYSKLSQLNNPERYTAGWQQAFNSETGNNDALVSGEIGDSGFQLKFYTVKAGENNALGLVKTGWAGHAIEAAIEVLERFLLDNSALLDDFLYDMHLFNALNFMDYYCND